MAGKLAGKIGIVTGAGQGVGRGIAIAMAAEGASVMLAGRRVAKLEEVKAEIERAGGTAATVACDVGVDADRINCVDATLKRFAAIDLLVNNAYDGPTGHNPLLGADPAWFQRGFDCGPMATLRFMQLCHPHMVKRGGGAIVNLATAGAMRWDMSTYGLYGAVKEAIRTLTRTAACEWGRDNIRTNTVAPLAMSPALEEWSTVNKAEAEAFYTTLPMGRIGDCVTDIGPAVVFLLSDDARYVNGMTMPLDGGHARFV